MAKVDVIGAWSEEKLEFLRRYLVAYTSIMTVLKKQGKFKEFAYVDAFAGSVTPEAKRTLRTDPKRPALPGFGDEAREAEIEYVDGSPLVALKTEPPFDVYCLNDKNQARIREKIVPLGKQFPGRRIEVTHGDCNEFLLNDIVPRFPWSSFKRAFVFVDPYGLQVLWDTIRALGEARTFDVYINFPIQAITRQLGDKPPTDEIRDKIDTVMGDGEWYDSVYTSRDLPLLGKSTMIRQKSVAGSLALLYANNLKRHFKHVSPPRIMTQQTNSPLYALILASQAELAVKKMNNIYTSFDKLKEKRNKRP